MRSVIAFLQAQPALVLLSFLGALGVGLLADLLTPLLPLVAMLFIAAMLALAGLAALLARTPGHAERAVATTVAGASCLALALLLGGQALAPEPGRGVLGGLLPPVAAAQDWAFGSGARIEQIEPELRAGLDAADPPSPRPKPRLAEEFLFNALVLARTDQPAPAAAALMESLRRAPDPRPDALLLYDALWASGLPAVREALAAPPAALAPGARALLEAMREADPRRRAALLQRLADQSPQTVLAHALVARALFAMAQPLGPTVAGAARIATAGETFLAAEPASGLAARFLRRSDAERLRSDIAALAGRMRQHAARRPSVAAQPAPGAVTLRLSLPEPAQSLQVSRGGAEWTEVPLRAGEALATLRLPAPYRPGEFRFRYADRDGVVSEPVAWRFEPLSVLRDSAQRLLDPITPFAAHAARRVRGTALNALAVPGSIRPALQAVEWYTDTDRRPRIATIALSEEALLRGELPDTAIDMTASPNARALYLTAILFDGTRTATREVPIR